MSVRRLSQYFINVDLRQQYVEKENLMILDCSVALTV